MNYVELNIPVADEAQAEILVAELSELPFESFASERRSLKAYIPQHELAECMEETEELLARAGVAGHRYVQIESQNWNALWESSFEEVHIDGRAVIRAPFHAPHPEYGELDIVIMPRMSFGTGHHATTALMTGYLLDGGYEGLRVLDMGCGTGVLAIVAAKRGAASVDAVDIDGTACENCRENCAANGVADCINVIEGDVRSVAARRYDVIAANINRNILLRDMEAYASMLGAGGRLFVSGFLEEDTESISACARSVGFAPAGVRTRDGWVAAAFTKE